MEHIVEDVDLSEASNALGYQLQTLRDLSTSPSQRIYCPRPGAFWIISDIMGTAKIAVARYLHIVHQ